MCGRMNVNNDSYMQDLIATIGLPENNINISQDVAPGANIVSIKHCGKALPYKVFDKLRQVNQAEVVDNKRLGAALAFVKRSQEERSEALERTRCSQNFSRTAQKKARQVNPVLLNPIDPDK